MANKIFKTRVIICNDTSANWLVSDKVLLKGEVAIEFTTEGSPKIKVGDGVNKFTKLPYATMTPAEIASAIEAANHSHANKDILDAIEVALTSALKANYDTAYTHSQQAHAPVEAQENVIETVKVNGSAVSVEGKTVDVKVPTKVSELENDTGFIKESKDTTYTLGAEASQANGSAKITLTGSEGTPTSVAISGTGKTTVTTDAEGKIVVDTKVDEFDDTELKGLIKSNTDAINVLNGEATEDGSVAKAVADAITKIVDGAPEDLNTLKEISAWIAGHKNDAAAMNLSIQGNDTAIKALAKLVGSLPEGATQETVIAYLEDKIASANENLTSAINAAKNEAISTASADATEKATAAETSAKSYADSLAGNYATSAQGTKADSAIQGVSVNGVELSPSADNKVNITSISTDILTQGTQPLVFDGGSATE